MASSSLLSHKTAPTFDNGSARKEKPSGVNADPEEEDEAEEMSVVAPSPTSDELVTKKGVQRDHGEDQTLADYYDEQRLGHGGGGRGSLLAASFARFTSGRFSPIKSEEEEKVSNNNRQRSATATATATAAPSPILKKRGWKQQQPTNNGTGNNNNGDGDGDDGSRRRGLWWNLSDKTAVICDDSTAVKDEAFVRRDIDADYFDVRRRKAEDDIVLDNSGVQEYYHEEEEGKEKAKAEGGESDTTRDDGQHRAAGVAGQPYHHRPARGSLINMTASFARFVQRLSLMKTFNFEDDDYDNILEENSASEEETTTETMAVPNNNRGISVCKFLDMMKSTRDDAEEDSRDNDNDDSAAAADAAIGEEETTTKEVPSSTRPGRGSGLSKFLDLIARGHRVVDQTTGESGGSAVPGQTTADAAAGNAEAPGSKEGGERRRLPDPPDKKKNGQPVDPTDGKKGDDDAVVDDSDHSGIGGLGDLLNTMLKRAEITADEGKEESDEKKEADTRQLVRSDLSEDPDSELVGMLNTLFESTEKEENEKMTGTGARDKEPKIDNQTGKRGKEPMFDQTSKGDTNPKVDNKTSKRDEETKIDFGQFNSRDTDSDESDDVERQRSMAKIASILYP